MDKDQVIKLVKEYAKLVVANMNVSRIILYGSYARGENRKYSDIDIAIIVPKSEIYDDILKQMAKLSRIAFEISSDIEPVLLIEGEDKSGFQEQILSYGEIIYSKVA